MYSFSSIISNFPGEPRDSQKQVIHNICNIFNSNKKYAVACVPTGVGKSHIAATLCRSMREINNEYRDLLLSNEAFKKSHDGRYLHEDQINDYPSFGGITLTTTKSLQNQYNDLFEDSEVLKGKNNYQCNVDPNFTVDLAPCVLSPKLKEKCLGEKTCAYYNRRGESLSSKFCVLNYNVFLSLPDFLKRRQVIICDEATEIEEIIISKYSVEISYLFLETESIPYKKLTSEAPTIALRWLNDLYINVSKIVSELLETVNYKSTKTNSIVYKDIKRLSRLTSFQESLNSVISSWGMSEYIIEKKSNNVSFTPYNVDHLAKTIFDSADNVILMSAFIPKKTIEFLGIKQEEYEYFEISSPFDPKKSPIYCSSKYPLSYNSMKKLLPKVIEQAVTICNGYKDQKGVIHTHSMQITEEFQKQVKNNNRFLFREHGTTNEDILLKHKMLTDIPTVVVSPSVAFGVSFDDDMGRFQIILKAPYMPLSSKRIKLLFERDPNYYQVKMLISLIQMCGRCTRNNQDFSCTFILDGTICKALHREVDKLPKYFLERFV
jgi:Rad3-related DNA helicase